MPKFTRRNLPSVVTRWTLNVFGPSRHPLLPRTLALRTPPDRSLQLFTGVLPVSVRKLRAPRLQEPNVTGEGAVVRRPADDHLDQLAPVDDAEREHLGPLGLRNLAPWVEPDELIPLGRAGEPSWTGGQHDRFV